MDILFYTCRGITVVIVTIFLPMSKSNHTMKVGEGIDTGKKETFQWMIKEHHSPFLRGGHDRKMLWRTVEEGKKGSFYSLL